jgi:hypothetical protein
MQALYALRIHTKQFLKNHVERKFSQKDVRLRPSFLKISAPSGVRKSKATSPLDLQTGSQIPATVGRSVQLPPKGRDRS